MLWTRVRAATAHALHRGALQRIPTACEVVEERGPAHEREFRVAVRLRDDVLAVGEGRSKQAAEKAAAEAALQQLPEEILP